MAPKWLAFERAGAMDGHLPPKNASLFLVLHPLKISTLVCIGFLRTFKAAWQACCPQLVEKVLVLAAPPYQAVGPRCYLVKGHG